MNNDDTDYEKGLSTRRTVLGDSWVDKSLANKTAFTEDFQDMITRHAWNDIWNRPGLTHKTRRIMVISVMMSLGHWEEFEMHIRAALQSEDDSRLTSDELKEVLMQNAIYAGIPAANTAFRLSQKILNEL